MARKKQATGTEAAAEEGEERTAPSPGPAPAAPLSPRPPTAQPPGPPGTGDGAASPTARPGVRGDDTELAKALDDASRLLSEARSRADGSLAQLQRVAADYENFKRFAERERAEAVLRERSATLSDFLDCYENLERAIDAGGQELPEGSRLMKGLRMTMEQMRGTLERAGVRPIVVVGKQFDPSLHEAVYFVSDASMPEYSVVEEVQRGYTMNGRVLRTAKVCVATRPAPQAPEGKGPADECPKDNDKEG